MADTDGELDDNSRQLLAAIDELKSMERKKRRTARSSPEFRRLARNIERKSKEVFDRPRVQERARREDSPIEAQRNEQVRGDWTDQDV